MRRAALAATALAALVLAAAASAFVIVPGPKSTRQCNGLAYCFGVAGPWVVVPAHGEATFLIGCPLRSKERGPFLLGGTDARVSSAHVHVSYAGKLGAPIGRQTPGTATQGLLFHASVDDGRIGSFQPVLGCIDLRQATKRSTLAAGPPVGAGKLSPAQPTFRARSLVLEPGWHRTLSVSCTRKERLVGSWSAVAFGTSGPPIAYRASMVAATTTQEGRAARTAIRTSAAVPYLIRVQVGAMCQR